MIAFISYVVSNLNTCITDVPAVNAATGSFCAGYMASSWGYYRSQDAREVAKVALNILDGLRKKDKKITRLDKELRKLQLRKLEKK